MNTSNILNHDELLDIVNNNDDVIDQQLRSHVYAQGISHFRVINAFLINDQGYVWIPRRSSQKKLFPSCLDASVGGHVMSGETYQQAFERELQEELNIEATQVTHKLIAKLTPHEHGVSAFMHVYTITTNIAPNYNIQDFASAEWISIPELQKNIALGEKTKGDLPRLINTLQKFL
jgi:isopentenyldiphosphate isomerase